MDNLEPKNNRKMNAILIAVSINFIMTAIIFGFIMIAAISETSTADSIATGLQPLPEGLTTEEGRDKLFEDFKMNYNSGDNAKLLSMFGKAYRLQLTEQEFDTSLEMIRKISSTIDDGAYSHYKFEELGSGITKFELFFNIRSPEGLRELTIQLTHQGDDSYMMFGFKINAP